MSRDNSQAIVLLAARFQKSATHEAKPLTPTEYGRFARWLHVHQRQPGDLIRDFNGAIEGWHDTKITCDRLEALLGRGLAMSIAMERWSSAGIWLLTRADERYPLRLRARFGDGAPPLIYGVGPSELLYQGGVAVVGSREAGPSELAATEQLGRQAAHEGINIVSGGAKGVDEAAMQSALGAGGQVVGVLADNLLRAALAKRWRPGVLNEQLCLISAIHPEAPFSVGQAMGRNKYVYALADSAVVICSEEGSGGTWAGANESLKKELCPTFALMPSPSSGNPALIALGARPIELPAGPVDEPWLAGALASEQSDGVAGDDQPDLPLAAKPIMPSEPGDSLDPTCDQKAPPVTPEPTQDEAAPPAFFETFCRHLEAQLRTRGALHLDDMAELYTEVHKTQLRLWVDRAVAEGRLKRLGRALRYELPETPLFG